MRVQKNQINYRANSALINIFLGLFIVFMGLFILGPLIWLAIHAFATEWVYPNLLPEGLTLKWWKTIVGDQELVESIKNSLLISPIVVLLSAVICLPAAYAFSRYEFFGRKTFLIGMFAANAFPKIGLFASIATLYYTLNLMGTVVGVIIVQLLGTIIFMTWIPAAAFGSVPRNLEDAARDAGASKLRTFRDITLRLAMPGILVAMVMSFLASFDEAQGTYLVGVPTIYTMPTKMYALVLNYPVQIAAVFSILLAVPSVLLISIARKNIIGGQLADGFQIK
jgi:putative spermidine/putrescine transport system permease protein